MKLSACMIVKNEEDMLKKTLPDLVKSVDEVILLDTGSTDATVSLAKEYGAKVYHFTWIDDFAAARNESLKYASGDWIIWIDADEYIKPEDSVKLKQFLSKAEGNSYNLPTYDCAIDSFKQDSFFFKLKVFRNGKGIHFERPINENIFNQNGAPVAADGLIEGVSIYHWGNHRNETDMKKKRERYIQLFKKAASEHSTDVNYHFLLAAHLKNSGLLKEAIAEYDEALKFSPRQDLHVRILTLKAESLYKIKNGKGAYLTACEALKLDENNPAALNIMGAILLNLSKTDNAIDAFEMARNVKLETKEFDYSRQKDYTANLLLGDAYLKKEEKDKAKEAFERALACDPTDEVKEKLQCL